MALLTIPEAAKRMGVTVAGARTSLDREGLIQRVGVRTLLVDEDQLQAFIARRGEFKPGRPPKTTEAVRR